MNKIYKHCSQFHSGYIYIYIYIWYTMHHYTGISQNDTFAFTWHIYVCVSAHVRVHVFCCANNNLLQLQNPFRKVAIHRFAIDRNDLIMYAMLLYLCTLYVTMWCMVSNIQKSLTPFLSHSLSLTLSLFLQ